MNAAQSKFEETVTDMLDRGLKGIMTVVQQQDQSLCKFSHKLQVTHQNVEVT
jgi:hypothetical protein